MKRDAAQTIFRTVVFAGAMLGAGACGKKPAPATPANTATEAGAKPADPAMMQGEDKPAASGEDPCANPCAAPRSRGGDEGGGTGRGFILS